MTSRHLTERLSAATYQRLAAALRAAEQEPQTAEAMQRLIDVGVTLGTAPASEPAVQWSYRRRNDRAIARRREQRSDEREKVCTHCGESFTATRSHAQTCSNRCRQALHRARERTPSP
jgi:hypothetical protein